MAVKTVIRKARKPKKNNKVDSKVVLGYIVIVLLLAGTFLLIKTIAGLFGGEAQEQEDLYQNLREAIEMEQGKLRLTSKTEGTVEITLTVPDFPALAQKAVKKGADDFRDYIENALKKGNFDTIETRVTAKVEVVDGDTIVDEEEAIKRALEPILIDMVNKVSEMED